MKAQLISWGAAALSFFAAWRAYGLGVNGDLQLGGLCLWLSFLFGAMSCTAVVFVPPEAANDRTIQLQDELRAAREEGGEWKAKRLKDVDELARLRATVHRQKGQLEAWERSARRREGVES